MTPILRPPALQPGDTIAIAALSSGMEPDMRQDYARGAAELEAMGFRVRAAPLVEREAAWWWGPARPSEVGRELTSLFRDPEVKAIWSLTGGRFTLSILDAIDVDVVAANPKPVIGMSDISVVDLALHSRTGLVTFHADSLVSGVSAWHELTDAQRAAQSDAYRRILTSTAPLGRLPALSAWETWRSGRAEGPLLGGMLNRLIKVQASPWALEPARFDGAILFLEDYNTPSINIWNDLQVLRLQGVFERIAGLIVGPVALITILEGTSASLQDVVLDAVGDRNIPILANVDCGHAGPNVPLPLGILAAMDADARSIELLEGAVA